LAPVRVCVIGLSATGPEQKGAVAGLPGVRAVQEQEGLVVVRADADASDCVLRAVLTGGAVHVRWVREEEEAPR